MIMEEKYEKKVEVKERPLGGEKVMETTEQKVEGDLGEETKVKETGEQVTERSEDVNQPTRAESAASSGGEAIGRGLKKVSTVVGGFAAGVQSGMKEGQPTKEEQEVEQQTQQMEEAPKAKVIEKEKVETKVTKEVE
jgi:hypothetical protein